MIDEIIKGRFLIILSGRNIKMYWNWVELLLRLGMAMVNIQLADPASWF
jgi:hypothetical protein